MEGRRTKASSLQKSPEKMTENVSDAQPNWRQARSCISLGNARGEQAGSSDAIFYAS